MGSIRNCPLIKAGNYNLNMLMNYERDNYKKAIIKERLLHFEILAKLLEIPIKNIKCSTCSYLSINDYGYKYCKHPEGEYMKYRNIDLEANPKTWEEVLMKMKLNKKLFKTIKTMNNEINKYEWMIDCPISAKDLEMIGQLSS